MIQASPTEKWDRCREDQDAWAENAAGGQPWTGWGLQASLVATLSTRRMELVILTALDRHELRKLSLPLVFKFLLPHCDALQHDSLFRDLGDQPVSKCRCWMLVRSGQICTSNMQPSHLNITKS